MPEYQGTNPYFDNYSNEGEQRLIEDLVAESIAIYGEDVLYVPRVITRISNIYTEDDQSKYVRAIPLVMYIKDTLGFGGEGYFMKNFGYQIGDQITFTVAKRVFEQELPDQKRPNEGDLIYFPLNEKCFQITFVDYKPTFYQLGILPTYDLTCKLFEYAGETFDTGVPEIDIIEDQYSTVMEHFALTDEDGNYLMAENNDLLLIEMFTERPTIAADDQSENLEDAEVSWEIDEEGDTGDLHVWSPKDPFSEGGEY